ncbi:MAG: hypothetical protein WB770_10270 [Acidimicrobiales bacterium]
MTRTRLVAVIGTLVLALVAAACGGSHTTLPQRLRAWESGASYLQDQSLISTDIREIATGIRTGPLQALHTACDGLAVDSANAYGELPTPEQALTSDLNDEYLTATNAAQSCSTSTSRHGGRIERYLTLIARAKRDLRGANARIARILFP